MQFTVKVDLIRFEDFKNVCVSSEAYVLYNKWLPWLHLFYVLDYYKHGHKRSSFLSLFGSGTFDPMGSYQAFYLKL